MFFFDTFLGPDSGICFFAFGRGYLASLSKILKYETETVFYVILVFDFCPYG